MTDEMRSKYRIVPSGRTRFNLEKWCHDVGVYLTEEVNIKNEQEAREIIKHLESEPVYLDNEDDN